MVSTALLAQHPDACRAIHLNLVMATPPPDVLRDPTEEERVALADVKEHARRGAGYAAIQSTRPQTIGYGLVDSPIALAAWILDKFAAWTDGPDFGDIHVDRLIDNLTLWWVTRSAASAARLYWESYAKSDLGPVSGPVGCTIFPGELSRPSRRWAASRFEDLVYYAHAESGGHFAALEQPAQFAQQLRAFAAEVKDV
jgi:pimeloyl-ACP methyl ester carboxylesterase